MYKLLLERYGAASKMEVIRGNLEALRVLIVTRRIMILHVIHSSIIFDI